MRVTSDFWVSALLRRVNASGGFGAVIRRGAAEAGAIFVLVRGRGGQAHLYGPAPQSVYDGARPDERFFSAVEDAGDTESLERRLERETRFDPDLWVVEIELADGEAGALLALTTP